MYMSDEAYFPNHALVHIRCDFAKRNFDMRCVPNPSFCDDHFDCPAAPTVVPLPQNQIQEDDDLTPNHFFSSPSSCMGPGCSF